MNINNLSVQGNTYQEVNGNIAPYNSTGNAPEVTSEPSSTQQISEDAVQLTISTHALRKIHHYNDSSNVQGMVQHMNELVIRAAASDNTDADQQAFDSEIARIKLDINNAMRDQGVTTSDTAAMEDADAMIGDAINRILANANQAMDAQGTISSEQAAALLG